MNRIKTVTAIAAALALFLMALATISADVSTPTCDKNDPASLCQGSVTVFVFLDRVEESGSFFFNSTSDRPLQGARVTFIKPDGSRQQQVTGGNGYLNFPSVDFAPGDEALVEVEYPAVYRGIGLVPCTNSPTRKQITREDFGSFGSLQVVFCAKGQMPDVTD